MSAGAVFRTPFTDLTGSIGNNQYYSKCGPLEFKMMNCLEAYGLLRGKQKCAELLEDFQECVSETKQNKRIEILQKERERQIAAGERSKEDYYAPKPRIDAY